MAAVTQRSPTKFAPSDWHLSNFTISSSAERQRSIAHDVRQQSLKLRNETENKSWWTQHQTDTDLQRRIKDTQSWRDTLEKTLHNTEQEINKLLEHKERVEAALEAKTLPLEVVLECLSLREGREGVDLVRDEVEGELGRELEVIEGIRGLLGQRVAQAFEQICVLQACHQQLHSDLTDKHTALQIDSECAQLGNASDTITMHTDPTRIKKGIVTPEQWESFSAHNVARAQEEMRMSTRLCEAINQTIQQTTTDLEAQWTATNYSFRKRIHEMEQAKHELEWQQKNTEVEIGEVEEEIRGLELSLADKTPPMMVVQTRLENRTFRPNVELCRDEPQYGMVEEVAEIAQSQQTLREKLAVAEHALGSLGRTLVRVKQDLLVKTSSLDLDQQCVGVREKLAQHPKTHQLTQPRDNRE